ncbi:SRPBCC domain-containing protein [Actinomadura barringtoniae]|uniref:SRPBCC domain-containing protein n=1 Tax=Actinomadura barringtoniae TaxID=1427535 RepID=A0A939T8N1_9ACTN|nr:SRPBCC domain-containing protein [Actinomadura barringtoniae]MBO2447085.1 SRPBCC domain-containing protein [Actinomadura barringtoniae]
MSSTTASPTRVDDASASAARRSTPRWRRRLLAALVGLVALLGGYTVWTNVHPFRLNASIEIQATPEEVWQVLTDFTTYPHWNPFLTSARVTSPGGRLDKGARLHIVMHDASGDSTFKPQVLTYAPGKELRWLGKIGPGWIGDGEHRFTIEQIRPGRVRLTQSERFTGVAVPFAHGMLKSNTLPQFGAMNRALAQRVETLHR